MIKYPNNTEYPNNIVDIYKNIDDYNPDKKQKIFNVFYMITDMLSNKKPTPIATELFEAAN